MYDFASGTAPWYDVRASITAVSLPEGLTSIGAYAFADCANLTSVEIPQSVTKVGDQAFYCINLKEVFVQSETAAWGTRVFYQLTDAFGTPAPSPTTVYGYTGSTIETYATTNNVPFLPFAFCGDNLIWTLVDGTLTISGTGEMDNFDSNNPPPWQDNCGDVEAIVIKRGVASIGSSAFRDCGSLTSVSLPNGLTTIGTEAFHSCGNLTDIVLPESVTSIGEYVFAFCNSLRSIVLPNGITDIAEGLFYYCANLETVEIPSGITSIGDYAFWECNRVSHISVPSNVTKIGADAFYHCCSLSSIDVENNNIFYSSDANGVLFNKAKTKLIQYPAGNSRTSYAIPESVTVLGKSAFEDSQNLTDITIPGSVINIGNWAFSNCSNLTSIVIPDSVTNIGEWAFSSCSSLTNMVLPDSITRLEKDVFLGCSSLTSINIPTSVTSIDEYAFAGSGLVDVTVPDSVNFIGNNAFQSCRELTNVTLPCGITGIEYGTFFACSSLMSIAIPDSVSYIGYEAFAGCVSLTKVTIPDSVVFIGSGAFRECSCLTSITIPASVDNIENFVFAGCDGLTIHGYTNSAAEVYANENIIPFVSLGNINTCGDDLTWTLADGKLTITGTGAMYDYASGTAPWYADRASITAVSLPDGITSIGAYAFADCTRLTAVTIPSTVTAIGANAFAGCTALTTAEICSLTATFGDNAFANVADSFKIAAYTDSTAAVYTIHNDIPFARLGSQYYGQGFSGNATASFENNVIAYRLTISGSGDMPDYGVTSAAPWYGIGNGINCSGTELGTGFGTVSAPLSDMLVSMSSSITSISRYAFSHSDGLTLTLPNSVTTIADYAFYHGDGLSITIPASVTTIAEQAFAGSTNVTIYGYTGSAAESYAKAHSITFVPLAQYCGDDLTWTLENGVLTITGTGAMYDYAAGTAPWYADRASITAVSLPDGITHIGAYAFADCTALTELEVESTTVTFGENVFAGVSDSFLLIADTESIAALYALQNAIPFGNREYRYGISMKSPVRILALDHNGNSYMTISSMPSNVIPSYGVTGVAPWYGVPLSANNEVGNWYGVSPKTLLLPDNIKAIGNYAFCHCAYNVVIPASVTSISDKAFYNSTSTIYGYTGTAAETYANAHSLSFIALDPYVPEIIVQPVGTTYTIGASVAALTVTAAKSQTGTYTCQWYKLTENGALHVGDTASTSEDAFQLISYYSPDISVIGTHSYYAVVTFTTTDANSAKIITSTMSDVVTITVNDTPTVNKCGDDLTWTLENGVLTITGTGAMYDYAAGTAPWYADRASITAVALPEGITHIGAYAFADCTALTSVTIPQSVTLIGEATFSGCSNVSLIGSTDYVAAYAAANNIPCSIIKYSLNYQSVKPYQYYTISGSGTMPDYSAENPAPWKQTALCKDVTINSGITSIGAYAFANWSTLNVTIPASVTAISEQAFVGSTNITILGYLGSAAETYAKAHSIAFIALDAGPTITVQPTSSIYIISDTASPLTITATANAGTLSCVWYKDGTAVAEHSSTTSTLTSSYAPDISVAGQSTYTVAVTLTQMYADGTTSTQTVSSQATITVVEPTGTVIASTWDKTKEWFHISLSDVTAVRQLQLVLKDASGAVLTTMEKAVETSKYLYDVNRNILDPQTGEIALVYNVFFDTYYVEVSEGVYRAATDEDFKAVEVSAGENTSTVITDNNGIVWTYGNGGWTFMLNNNNYFAYYYMSICGNLPTTGVDANNNFYSYANGTWIANSGSSLPDTIPTSLLFENTNLTTFLYTNSTADTGWTQTAWTPSASQVPTTLELIVDGQTADTFTLSVNAADWAATFPTAAASISGQVTSYDPLAPTSLQLWQNGELVQVETILSTVGSGRVTQSFTIDAVPAGTYDLHIVKGGHLPCIIRGIVVDGSTPVLLTAHANASINNITLAGGDINGDGTINIADVALVRAGENYGSDLNDQIYNFSN